MRNREYWSGTNCPHRKFYLLAIRRSAAFGAGGITATAVFSQGANQWTDATRSMGADLGRRMNEGLSAPITVFSSILTLIQKEFEMTLSLVTGANGHLGNNLVRALLSRGEKVRAGVRNLASTAPFEGLDCERVYCELLDEQSLAEAMRGVTTLYQVAAAFKHWSKDPEKEIYQNNLAGTERVLRAAHLAGVEKIVYVSSVAAVGHDGTKLDENAWNDEKINAYYRSKIDSEKLAWKLAEELGLNMVSVLPGTMVGPNDFGMTDSMMFLENLRLKKVPFDLSFNFNFVDVRDIAEACISAASTGKKGQRYILANDYSLGINEVIRVLSASDPSYKSLPKAPKWLLLCIAWFMEHASKISKSPAKLMTNQVELFYGVAQEYSINKARQDLNYAPRSPEAALAGAFGHLAA